MTSDNSLKSRIFPLLVRYKYNTQGCSLGLELLGLETVSRRFFQTSRSRLDTVTPMSRSLLRLETLTSRSRLGIIGLIYNPDNTV